MACFIICSFIKPHISASIQSALSMADTTVLRLSRPQHGPDEADFVLVQVIPQGRSPLDLKLIGTESSLVFSASCKLATGSTAGRDP